MFLNRILPFNKRVDLANWLSCEYAKRIRFMSKRTGQNLQKIRDTLQAISWSRDINTTETKYNKTCPAEKRDKRAKMIAERTVCTEQNQNA